MEHAAHCEISEIYYYYFLTENMLILPELMVSLGLLHPLILGPPVLEPDLDLCF